jgi:hypothetical protein
MKIKKLFLTLVVPLSVLSFIVGRSVQSDCGGSAVGKRMF